MTECEVLVLGAGMSGLCMAMQLQRAGIHDFVVLEKSAGLGGTWWDNRYPGAQVDVPAPLYAFSFAPNPRWARRFAEAAEIQAYMQHCVERHRLLGKLRFDTRVVSAVFCADSGRWAVTTHTGAQYSARFFVCSTGPLSQPRWPDIPGLDSFAGQRLHSARWNAAVPLAGRRIAVIGTGSSAAQLVPPLAAQAAQLHVFQRTANWVLPRMDRRYNRLDHALAHLPPYAAAVRLFWYRVLELGRHGFDEGSAARRAMQAAAARLLQRQVADPILRERLRPRHPLGCKRIIYSNDYLRTLARPNVELVTDAISHVTADAMVSADGRARRIDALVCATGFDTTQLLASVDVRGLHGQTLAGAWRHGPEAWRGLAVAGFPNLFLLLGPNTATGHTSTLLYIEPEVRFAIACMQELLRQRPQGRRWMAVKPAAMLAYNQHLQARLQGSVWAACRSWYRMDDGKIIAIWPGFTREYVAALRRPDFALFDFG